MEITKDIIVLLIEYNYFSRIEILYYSDNCVNPHVYYSNSNDESFSLAKMEKKEFLYHSRIKVKKNSEFIFSIIGDKASNNYHIHLGKDSHNCYYIKEDVYVEEEQVESVANDIEEKQIESVVNDIEEQIENITNEIEESDFQEDIDIYDIDIDDIDFNEQNVNSEDVVEDEVFEEENCTFEEYDEDENIIDNDYDEEHKEEKSINEEYNEEYEKENDIVEEYDDEEKGNIYDETSLIVIEENYLKPRKGLRFSYKMNKQIKIMLIKLYRLMPNFIKGDYRRRINL